jgi:hypothetical protein
LVIVYWYLGLIGAMSRFRDTFLFAFYRYYDLLCEWLSGFFYLLLYWL